MSEPVDYYIAAIVSGIDGYYDDTSVGRHITVPVKDVRSLFQESIVPDGKLLPILVTLLKNKKLWFAAIHELNKSKYFEYWEEKFGDDLFHISDYGKFHMHFSLTKNSPYLRAINLEDTGADWLKGCLKNVNSSFIKEGAFTPFNSLNELENDTWQPLPIEREDPLFQTGFKALEEALKTIEADNGYAATEPEERNAILASAKGTVEALKDGNPSKETVSATLITPFKYLAKKFGDGIIGAAAKTIWEFGIKLLTFGS